MVRFCNFPQNNYTLLIIQIGLQPHVLFSIVRFCLSIIFPLLVFYLLNVFQYWSFRMVISFYNQIIILCTCYDILCDLFNNYVLTKPLHTSLFSNIYYFTLYSKHSFFVHLLLLFSFCAHLELYSLCTPHIHQNFH